MSLFHIVVALMLALALSIVIVPLYRRRPAASTSLAHDQSNVALLRQQREEILRDFASGVLTEQGKDEALTELAQRAGEEVFADIAAPAISQSARRPWLAMAAVMVLLPMLAALLYYKLGSPEVTRMAALATSDSPAFSDKQVLDMVESLAAKMKQKPDDADGWMLLGRSYAALGRFADAVTAYERANRLAPGNAQLLADYADSLGMTLQKSLDGKPFELIQQALKIDPDNRKALALAGSAELTRRNFAASLEYWQRLKKVLEPGSEEIAQVDGTIEEIRIAMGGTGGGAMPAAIALPGAAGISGKVSIASSLAAKAAPDDTLFIFARAANWQQGGPKMPLAILKLKAGDLPRDFELSDAMAMMPNLKLSDFPEVVVEARVSKSGNAMTQNGDLQGISAAVKPGAKNIAVVIDREVQ
jgi:cytochrome c-type biogenesis protein CcmH